jgi:hypothetical protein
MTCLYDPLELKTVTREYHLRMLATLFSRAKQPRVLPRCTDDGCEVIIRGEQAATSHERRHDYWSQPRLKFEKTL